MTHKRLFLIALLLVCGLCHAQEELPTISADRPGALTGTDVMPLYKLQWETGMGYESVKGGTHTFTINNTLLRFGLFENAELRVGTDLLMWNDDQATEHTFGFTPLTVGIKASFYEGKGFLPSVALLAELQSHHIGTKELIPSNLTPILHLLFEHSVIDWFGICYNVGAEWDGETATPTTFLGLGLYFDISEHISTFVETYNYIHPDDDNQYLTEFGFTWLVSRRVQLDLAADLDFQNLDGFYAISGGVAWLIN
ncbi:MAG: transporter [Bacteroidales bacterium]|nr:transporter [Bacteroidales bacterium]